MLLVFSVAEAEFIFSLRSKMSLNGKLYNESPLFAYTKVDFFRCPQARVSSLTPKEKSHRPLSMAFLVAGTGLEPVTFGL